MIISQNLLTDKIENHIKSADALSKLKRSESSSQRVTKFYPSNIGKCCRYIWYDMMGYPRPAMEPRILRICRNGDSMHERYQKWFEEMGILVANEYPIKFPELRISGRLDSIIRTVSIVPAIDDIAIVELKSANNKKFSKMVRENLPLPEYIDQIHLYMELLQIPYGIILVENKNDQELLEFWVEYDVNYGKKLLSKVQYVNNCVTKNQLPNRDYSMSSYECRYCDYRDICWPVSVT
jgi:CRISPR/Cas system-associated exonuclease Cas4 (RecB family)